MTDSAAVGLPPYPSAWRAWATVALLSVLFIVSFVDRFVLALLIEPLKADLKISDTQIGLLIGTVFAMIYVFLGVPLARVADVWNRRNLVVIGALVWTLTTTASAFSTSFLMLLVLRIGVAVGEGVLTPTGVSMIADMFPRERRTVPSSVFIGVGSAGANLALFLAAAALDFATTPMAHALPLIGALSPWRLTLFLVGAPGALLALLFLVAAPEPTRREFTAERPPLSAVFRHVRENGLTYFGFFSLSVLGPLNVVALLTWFPSFLVRAHGMTAADAGYRFGLIGVIGMISGCILVPAAGSLLARRGRSDAQILVYVGAVVIGAPLLAAALLVKSTPLALALVGPGFALMAGTGAMLGTTSPLLAPNRLRAVMMSLVSLGMSGASFGLGPLIVALLSQHVFTAPDGLGKALAAQIALTMPIAILLALVTRRAFARSMENAAALEAGRRPPPAAAEQAA